MLDTVCMHVLTSLGMMFRIVPMLAPVASISFMVNSLSITARSYFFRAFRYWALITFAS